MQKIFAQYKKSLNPAQYTIHAIGQKEKSRKSTLKGRNI